jgi:hypothetical protein
MRLATILTALVVSTAASTQQPMATVSSHDAQVTGGLQVQGERATLVSNASITAFDHTAPVTLARGGDVLVCSTSQFHLLHVGVGDALLFGLDRGALELHTKAEARDMILTPDIRFTVEHAGDFNLRVRVTRNGDTCVDNAGKGAPVLLLTDSFGAANYRLIPGQHVMFERGSLHEVVDNERSSCGCPKAPPAGSAAAKHAFPEAESEGLAPTAVAQNDAPAGQKQTQIAASLSYLGDKGSAQPVQPATVDPTATGPATTGPATNPAAARTQPQPARGFFGALGHFFHKLFHPHDDR